MCSILNLTHGSSVSAKMSQAPSFCGIGLKQTNSTHLASEPADTHLPFHCAPNHPSHQYRWQQDRSHRRLCACCRPQGDADHQAVVRRRPRVFSFVSVPIDIVPHSLGSLGGNELCGVTSSGSGTYTTEGITKLCEGLKGSAVTLLRCAATQWCSLSCQRPSTRLPNSRLTLPPQS